MYVLYTMLYTIVYYMYIYCVCVYVCIVCLYLSIYVCIVYYVVCYCILYVYILCVCMYVCIVCLYLSIYVCTVSPANTEPPSSPFPPTAQRHKSLYLHAPPVTPTNPWHYCCSSCGGHDFNSESGDRLCILRVTVFLGSCR